MYTSDNPGPVIQKRERERGEDLRTTVKKSGTPMLAHCLICLSTGEKERDRTNRHKRKVPTK